MAPAIQTAPAPVFGARDQVRAERIALDIPADRQAMLVILHGKRFEPPLIQMPRPRTLPISMPALRVSQRQPTHEPR